MSRLKGLTALLVALTTMTSPALGAVKVYETHYGLSETEKEKIYVPEQTGPLVLFVHGGGWRFQTLANTDSGVGSKAKEVAEHGAAVFNINYPQDSETEVAFPLETAALERALTFAVEHAAQYHADASNKILIGGSAGGQLVMRVAESTPVQGVVSLSGPTNFASLVELAESKKLSASLATSVGQALGCDAFTGPCSEEYEREWSPVDHVPQEGCPAWALFSAEVDKVPLSQAQEMLAATSGCESSLTVVPGKGHAFSYWSAIKAQVFSFVGSH